jgi:predicted PurR-regulated permease PerM
MSTADNGPPAERPDNPKSLPWPVLLRKLAVWALFLAGVYVARDFFFTAFMTFLFSYLALALVGWGMRRLAPGRDRPALRRLLTVAVFVLIPLILVGVGVWLAPRLLQQGKLLAGRLSQVSPETEVSRLLEGFVGPAEFKDRYGGPLDPRYQKGLEEFRKSGERHVAAYNAFPQVEAWMEGGFSKQFADAESGRIRAHLLREGTSSQDFEQWFRTVKFPELQRRAQQQAAEKGQPPPADPLVRAAASATPEQLLQQVRHDPTLLGDLRADWVNDAVQRGLAAAKQGPVYHQEFRAFYEQQRAQEPDSSPYTFDEYLQLQAARPHGRVAFGAALEKLRPSAEAEGDAQLRADFEAAKKHELFQEWWGTSAPARFLRHEVESGVSGGGEGRLDRILSSLLNVPLDLSTALLLSFFICIDFPALRRAAGSLRATWLGDVYEDLARPLADLGLLVARAMQAQGLIALCNATLLFLALWFLGVTHPLLLAGAVFVLCLVPTLGTLIAWVLLAGVALLQPGGGLVLALKVTGAVVGVILLETFVFSPRILGKMMELHPVLIIALLPLAQYFFGVWGLILATPVAVYVVHVLILRRGLPGGEAAPEARPDTPASQAPPADTAARAPVAPEGGGS